MIRYPVGRQELLDRINALRPQWIANARARTDAYAAAQDYTGGTDFWGEIKQIYIDLQHEKCAYCETKLQGSALASKVHEVEHFRPKSSVKDWPNRNQAYWRDFPSGIATGAADPKGYYLLAYHPFNYAIACTRCNSTLKSNYFPVRGARDVGIADPSLTAGEDALLLYPMADIDTDPALLITFDGVLAVPRQAAGADHERALTTIWFFQLNHEDLTTRRAEMLAPLWSALEHRRLADDAGDRQDADDTIRLTCDATGQFSACMKAFCELYVANRARAREKANEARAMMRRGLGQAVPPSS